MNSPNMNTRPEEDIHCACPKKADFEWENAKENVIPLRRGRNVPTLNDELRKHHEKAITTRVTLQTETDAWEQKLAAYQGKDILSIWVQYIRWIETKMPQDTRKKFQALEQCTRSLKEYASYQNDQRYIRIWIQYADMVSNPKDIFKYLYQNKIGEYVALLYVAWALIMESAGNHAQAHKIYMKAIQKKAEPQAMAKQKYEDFQRRMSRHWLRKSDHKSVIESVGNEKGQREVLEDLYTFDGFDQGQQGLHRKGLDQVRSKMEQQQRTAFQIHEDSSAHSPDTCADNQLKWKEIGTAEEQDKENTIRPALWNRSGLQSSKGSLQEANREMTYQGERPSQSLQVFVDDVFAKQDPQRPTSTSAKKRCLHQRNNLELTEEELLRKEPLKNFDNLNSELKTRDVKRARPVETLTNSVARSEIPAYNANLVQRENGSMLSFEEVRAQMHMRKVQRKSCELNDKRTAPISRDSGSECVSNAFLAPTSSRECITQTSRHPSNSFTQVPRQSQSEADIKYDASVEDVTINTRVAMADVNDMFCSPRPVKVEVLPAINDWRAVSEEPIERKLQFNIYDDSLNGSLPAADDSLQHAKPDTFDKAQARASLNDSSKVSTSTTNNSSKKIRKPLAPRDDIVKKTRLTNRDVILKIQQNMPDTTEVSHPAHVRHH